MNEPMDHFPAMPSPMAWNPSLFLDVDVVHESSSLAVPMMTPAPQFTPPPPTSSTVPMTPVASTVLDSGTSAQPKRTRPSKACSACRLIKRKCDGGAPCSRCVERGIPQCCIYVPRRNQAKIPRMSDVDDMRNSHSSFQSHAHSSSQYHDQGSDSSDNGADGDSDCEEGVRMSSATTSHRSAASATTTSSTTVSGMFSRTCSDFVAAMNAPNFGIAKAATNGTAMVSMDASRRNVTSFLENLDPRLQGFNSFRFIQRFLQRRPQGDSTSEAVIRIVDNIRPTNGFADYLLTVDMSRFVSRDVALRHRVEDAQNLVNASAFPAIMTVVTGRLHAYNSALVEVSRFSREDLDDPEFAPLELLDDESLPHYLKTSIALRENPKLSTSSFRARLRRKDGRRIEYCAGVTYVRDTGSKLVCSVIVFTPMPE